jgi:hypothetical protein
MALSVAMEGCHDRPPLLYGGKSLMVAQLTSKEEVDIESTEHGSSGSGADTNAPNLDVPLLACWDILWCRNTYAIQSAETLSYAGDESTKALWL